MGDKGNVSQIRSNEPAWGDAAAREPSRTEEGRRRRRSRSSYKAERKLQGLQIVLAILVSVLVLGTVTGAMLVSRLATERDQLAFKLRQLERDLAAAVEEADLLREERDGLVKERIPGLQLIAYDETIQIGEQYVRNVAFTLVRQDGADSYEYRIVLSNTGVDGVQPRVTIGFFDELGVQAGQAAVSIEELTEDGQEYTLEPDEVRTHTGVIEVSQGTTPKYFLLSVK